MKKVIVKRKLIVSFNNGRALYNKIRGNRFLWWLDMMRCEEEALLLECNEIIKRIKKYYDKIYNSFL